VVEDGCLAGSVCNGNGQMLRIISESGRQFVYTATCLARFEQIYSIGVICEGGCPSRRIYALSYLSKAVVLNLSKLCSAIIEHSACPYPQCARADSKEWSHLSRIVEPYPILEGIFYTLYYSRTDIYVFGV